MMVMEYPQLAVNLVDHLLLNSFVKASPPQRLQADFVPVLLHGFLVLMFVKSFVMALQLHHAAFKAVAGAE